MDRGAGIPTLFLHGVPDSGEMWLPLIRRLESRYRCLAPDLPGLGRSTAPADFDLSHENKARFVDELLNALEIVEPVNLIVHDFGGHYGLAWAVTHPDRVRRLAIFSTSFFPDYRWHPGAQMWRIPVLGELNLATMPRGMWRATLKSASPALPDEVINNGYELSIKNPAVRQMILRLYRTTDPKGFASWEQKLLALTKKAPTLVLWGDRDPFIAKAFADRFGGQVRHFPDNSHWLPVEAPEAVAEALLEFLA
jgi:pimeloyl-ACP methyl ester carboxylesterase